MHGLPRPRVNRHYQQLNANSATDDPCNTVAVGTHRWRGMPEGRLLNHKTLLDEDVNTMAKNVLLQASSACIPNVTAAGVHATDVVGLLLLIATAIDTAIATGSAVVTVLLLLLWLSFPALSL